MQPWRKKRIRTLLQVVVTLCVVGLGIYSLLRPRMVGPLEFVVGTDEQANLVRIADAKEGDFRGWLLNPLQKMAKLGLSSGGATSCKAVHVGEIRVGAVRANHRHHSCNETFIIWNAKAVFRVENKSMKNGYAQAVLSAEEISLCIAPVGVAHAIVNIDQAKPLYFMACQDAILQTNNLMTDYKRKFTAWIESAQLMCFTPLLWACPLFGYPKIRTFYSIGLRYCFEFRVGLNTHAWSSIASSMFFPPSGSGIQNVSIMQKEEAWKVNVRLQGCDIQHGYLCGSMEALNVPSAETPVVTFWEGQIVDNRNYTFYTGQWDATPETDVRHWSKFSCFSPLKDEVERDGGRSLELAAYPYIFMRWKEKFFVNVGADCGLTIAGFYYVCFSRSSGTVQGFYYDPNSSPYQKLELKATNEGRSGSSFASYQFQ